MISNNWRANAACAEIVSDEWFPRPRSAVNPLLLRVCGSCPVWRDCLLYALAQPDIWHGIWAGLSAREVAELRAQLLSGEPAADVIDNARQIVDNRDPVTIYQTAAAKPLPSDRELQRQHEQVRAVLSPASLRNDTKHRRGSGRAA